MKRFAFALVALFSFSGIVLAHGGVEHMRGTVTEITDKAITIATPEKQTKTVRLLPATTFLKSGAAATSKDVKVGDRVVVDVVVKGQAITAQLVRFGPTAATKGSSGQQRKPDRQ